MKNQSVQFIINGATYEIRQRHDGAGFNVVQSAIINPMPGATGGFKTIEKAVLAIRVLEHVGKDGPRFWDLWYRVSGVTQRSRLEREATAKRLGYRVERISRHENKWVRSEPVSQAQ